MFCRVLSFDVSQAKILYLRNRGLLYYHSFALRNLTSGYLIGHYRKAVSGGRADVYTNW